MQNVSLKLSELNDVACSGTIYATLLLAESLCTSYQVVIYHKGESGNDGGIQFCRIDSEDNLVSIVNSNSDVVIAVGEAGQLLKKYQFTCEKKIYWLHNHENLREYRASFKIGRIDKIVTVCAYQLISALRCGLILSSTYVYNPYKMIKVSKTKERCTGVLKIAFVGALVEEKGIGNLFRLYSDLLDSGIKVELNLFGNGNLYGDKNILGKTRALSVDLEKKYNNFIFNSSGQLRYGLKFHGLLSKHEIMRVLPECHVFISGLNESGAAECFSISFLDAQASGVKVLTLNRGGQAESILTTESGKVFDTVEKISSYIKSNINYLKTHSFDVSSEFSQLSLEKIRSEWVNIIEEDNVFWNKIYYSIYRFMSTLLSSLKRIVFNMWG